METQAVSISIGNEDAFANPTLRKPSTIAEAAEAYKLDEKAVCHWAFRGWAIAFQSKVRAAEKAARKNGGHLSAEEVQSLADSYLPGEARAVSGKSFVDDLMRFMYSKEEGASEMLAAFNDAVATNGYEAARSKFVAIRKAQLAEEESES